MQPNLQQPQPQPSQTSQSFKQIQAQVQSLIEKEDYPQLKQLLEKEARLAESLTYYKVAASGDQAQIYDRVEKLQAKWQLGADVSQEMKQQIVYPLIDQLNIDVQKIIELCDWYFQANRVNYEQIIQSEKIIADIQRAGTQQLQPQTFMANQRSQLDGWHNNLKIYCQRVVSEVKLAYFFNRLVLVNLIMTLAVSQNDQVTAILKEMLRKPGAVLNICQSLIRNVDWDREFAQLPTEENKEKLALNVYNEQISLLNTLLAFWSDYGPAKKEEQESFMQFLNLTQFQGKMRRGQVYGESPAESGKRHEIKVLSQLVALAMMGLKSQNPASHCQMNFEPLQLTQVNSFVYFPIAVITNKIAKYDDHLSQLPLLEEFSDVMTLTFRPDFILKGKAIGLLNSWLNLLFDNESSKQANHRNNYLIDQILQIGLELLKDQSAIASVWKDGIKSLRIYREVFDSPIKNFEKLMVILSRLCGSQKTKKTQCASKVMDLIQEMNLWPEIFSQITKKLQQLYEQKLNQIEIFGLIYAITLLTKIIKQTPDMYQQLQVIYSQSAIDCKDGKLRIQQDMAQSAQRRSGFSAVRDSIRQDSGLVFESGDFSLIIVLVKALHNLFYLDFEYGNKPICKVLDALTKVFKNFPETQSVIFDLLYKFTSQRQDRIPQLIEYISDLSQFRPQQLISFFKFVEVAFKNEDSFKNLPENEVYYPSRNFLFLSLTQVFTPLVQNYSNIQFTNEKQKSSFMNQIFRLTYVLLSKFDQVDDNGQKVLLVQPTPYFDYQFQVLAEVLHPPQISQMCIQALSIIQSRIYGNEQGFINKAQSDLDGQEESRHFVRMINSAIKVLNKLLSLALSTGQTIADKDTASLQSTYITNMLSIQDFKKCITDQQSLRMDDQTILTIPALLAFYIQPSGMVSHDKIRIGALEFLKNSLQILRHSNFLSTLKQTFGPNLQTQLSFINILKEDRHLPLSIAYVEFWIQVIETQGNLAEEIWQTKDTKSIIETLQNPFDKAFLHLKNTLKQKICILVSLMSIKRCCIKILETNSQSVLSKIYECVVGPLLEEVNDAKLVFNGDVLNNVNNVDATVLEVVSSLNAKVTIYYFMKLLQNEFERETSSKTVRLLVEKLYCNKSFQALAVGQNPEETYQILFGQVQHINDMFLRDNQSRPHSNQARLQAISRIPGFDERFQAGKVSSLFSPDGSVYLSNLNNKDQYDRLESTSLHTLHNSVVSMSDSNSKFGAQFVVDVQELRSKLIQEGYDVQIAEQITCIFREFNLVLSTVTVNTVVLKAKTEFLLRVSQTQMLVVQRKDVPADLLLTASMMALISSEEIYPKNKEQVLNQRLKLVDWSVNQVKAIFSGIDKSRNKVENTMLFKHLEAQIQNLTVHLGVVGHLVSALGNDQLLRKEIPNFMVALLSSLPDNGFFKNDNKESHTIFCQVITLILQIQVTLKQECQATTILKSLGNVITGLQRGHSMIEGIQIFILICDMIDSDSLVALMNRQSQGSPLQFIISRIQDPKISSEEMQLILTLLQNFARSVEGSENLHKNKVLYHLINSESYHLLDIQNPYITINQEQNRNHIHSWWLQVLALVRQMNTNLIKNPRVSDSGYYKDLNRIIKILTPRFQSVLSVTLPQVAPSATSTSSVLSIAVLEETELICQILSQMFQHADFWQELDKTTYAEMKDLMLFAVPKIFNNCNIIITKRTFLPSSVTERYLAGISASGQDRSSQLGVQNERTALQLKMEMSMVSAIMSCTASLNNIVTLQKQNNQAQIICTWGRIDSQNQSDFERTYLNTQVREPYLQFAFENYIQAMSGLKDLYVDIRKPQNQVKKMITTLSTIFLTDQWILSEYQGGLASILIEESFENLLENIEVTLAMGMYVLSGILEQIQSVLAGVVGFTGGSAYGGSKYQTLNYGIHDQSDMASHGQIEERHLVLMAKNLATTIKQLQGTVDQNNPPWANENYLQSVLAYAESLADNRQGTMHYY